MSDRNTRHTPDDPLGKRARDLFDRSVEDLDAATLSRLNRNRQAALAAASRPTLFGRPALIPAAGVAAAAVAALLFVTNDNPGLEPVRTEAASDFEILLDGDDLEMLEDLEFYSWIEFEPETDPIVG